MTKIEIEVESLEQAREAVEGGADVIMLDNMAPEAMKECVDMIGHRAVVEASGGIDEHNLEAAAAAGVDVISIGALTHSVKALDISLDVGEIKYIRSYDKGLLQVSCNNPFLFFLSML